MLLGKLMLQQVLGKAHISEHRFTGATEIRPHQQLSKRLQL